MLVAHARSTTVIRKSMRQQTSTKVTSVVPQAVTGSCEASKTVCVCVRERERVRVCPSHLFLATVPPIRARRVKCSASRRLHLAAYCFCPFEPTGVTQERVKRGEGLKTLFKPPRGQTSARSSLHRTLHTVHRVQAKHPSREREKDADLQLLESPRGEGRNMHVFS